MAVEYITARGLQGAVAIVTARMADLDLTQDELLGETPPGEALHALSHLVASVLGATSPSGLTSAVRAAGRVAGRLEANSDGA